MDRYEQMARPWWLRWTLTERAWLMAPQWLKTAVYGTCYGWRPAERRRMARIRAYWDQ